MEYSQKGISMTNLLEIIGLIAFLIFLVVVILAGTVAYKIISFASELNARRRGRLNKSANEFDRKWDRYNDKL